MKHELSKVYRIGNPENDEHHFTDQKEHADIAKKNGYEVSEYVLAAHEREPVAYMIGGHYLMHANDPKVDNYASAAPLYTHPAPSIPAAVPECFINFHKVIGDRHHGRMPQEVQEAFDECAAMLQSEPDGWIPVSERLPEDGGRYWCYVEEQNSLGKSHYQWNCSWNGSEWSDAALTGRVTHWQPLPAAPKV